MQLGADRLTVMLFPLSSHHMINEILHEEKTEAPKTAYYGMRVVCHLFTWFIVRV